MTQRLEHGRYDAVIVDVERRGDGIAMSCTITSGEQRGAVVDIVTSNVRVNDELSLLGMPCTLDVRDDGIRIVDL